MNKTLLIVASLALGTTAIAQDMPAGAPADPSQSMATSPAPAGGDAGAPMQSGSPADSSAMPQTPDSGAAPSATPDNSTPPSGGMSAPMGGQGGAAAPTDTSSYPKCGKGVTDKCVQAGGAGHKAMAHHPMKHRKHK